MGRTFLSSASRVPNPAFVKDKPDPDFPTWSYANQWDPDSDEFWENAITEKPAGSPQLPSPVESSDTSEESASTGPPSPWASVDDNELLADAGLPRNLYLPELRVRPLASSLSATRPRSASDHGRAFLGPTATPAQATSTPRDLSRLTDLEPLNWNPRRTRAETVQIHDGADAEAEPRPVLVHTSSITPIPVPARPSTPPNARARGSFADEDSFGISPSPPPSVSPRVFVWEHARRMPESPVLRRAPLPWPFPSQTQRV